MLLFSGCGQFWVSDTFDNSLYELSPKILYALLTLLEFSLVALLLYSFNFRNTRMAETVGGGSSFFFLFVILHYLFVLFSVLQFKPTSVILPLALISYFSHLYQRSWVHYFALSVSSKWVYPHAEFRGSAFLLHMQRD